MVRKDFNQLAKSSKDKYSSILKRLHTSGITSKEALVMSNSELKKTIGFKGKLSSLNGLKRNISAIKRDSTKKRDLPNYTLKSYKKFGYRGKKLQEVKIELNKTIGSTFYSISDDIQKKRNISEKEADKRVNFLLKLDKKKLNDTEVVSEKERDILRDYGY